METRTVEIRNNNRVVEGTQFTLQDERWYLIKEIFYPSVTWINGLGFPTAEHLKKYYGSMSYSEAKRLLEIAGERGSIVHDAIDRLIKGEVLKQENFSVDVWSLIDSVQKWWEDFKPVVMRNEYTVYSEQHWFAGTVDLKCLINGKVVLVDFKTSAGIYDSHKMQVAAYKVADFELGGRAIDECMIVQFGNEKALRGYKVELVKDPDHYFKLFKATQFIFRHVINHKTKPELKAYPVEISINVERQEEYGDVASPSKKAKASTAVPKKRLRVSRKSKKA